MNKAVFIHKQLVMVNQKTLESIVNKYSYIIHKLELQCTDGISIVYAICDSRKVYSTVT